MEVTLANFACYPAASFTFVDGLCLIKGASGAGKTTLLRAILWALYGKVKNIYPAHNNKTRDRPRVTLRFRSGLTITREANPRLLTVISRGQAYQDDEAQAIINTQLSSHIGFESLAYIAQKEVSVLLSGSQSDKMELLRELIFHGESPLDRYLVKLRTRAEELESVIQFTRGGISSLETLLVRLQSGVSYSTTLSEDQARLITRATELEREVAVAEETRRANNFLQGQISLLRSHLRGLDLGGMDPHETEATIEIKIAEGQRMTMLMREAESQQRISQGIAEARATLAAIDVTDSDLATLKERLSIARHQLERQTLARQISRVESQLSESRAALRAVSEREGAQLGTATRVECGETTESEEATTRVEEEAVAHVTTEEATSEGHEATDLGIDDEEIGRLQEQWRAYNEGLKGAAKVHLDYAQIPEAIKLAREAIMSAGRMNLLSIKKRNEVKIAEIRSQFPIEVTEEMCHQAQRRLNDIRTSKEAIPCPVCKSSLIYREGHLYPLSESKTTAISEAEVEATVKKVMEGYRNWQQLYRYERENASIEGSTSEYREINVAKLHDFVMKLSAIKVVDRPPFTLEQLAAQASINQHQRELTRLRALYKTLTEQLLSLASRVTAGGNVSQLGVRSGSAASSGETTDKAGQASLDSKEATWAVLDREVTTEEVSELAAAVEKASHQVTKRRELTSSLAQLLPLVKDVEVDRQLVERLPYYLEQLEKWKEHHRLVSIRELESKLVADDGLEAKRNEQARVREDLERIRRSFEYLEHYNNMLRQREVMRRAEEELVALGRFKEKMIEAEYLVLARFIRSINDTIADITPLVFDDPIEFRFSVYKEMKTDKRVKPSITFCASYKEMEVTDLRHLSGGEGDRLSLSIVIALNKFFNVPLLMLDETIGSLDEDLKKRCLGVIRAALGTSKPVLIVNHDGVEGSFDTIVNVRSS
jgi:DNA repair exonuclease SbcCD ATPase subunit